MKGKQFLLLSLQKEDKSRVKNNMTQKLLPCQISACQEDGSVYVLEGAEVMSETSTFCGAQVRSQIHVIHILRIKEKPSVYIEISPFQLSQAKNANKKKHISVHQESPSFSDDPKNTNIIDWIKLYIDNVYLHFTRMIENRSIKC